MPNDYKYKKNLFKKHKQKEPKTVENIELSKKHIVIRVILFVVFLIGGVVGIVLGVQSCTGSTQDVGWAEITSSDTETCADNFTLMYYFSKSNGENVDEKRTLTNLYTSVTNTCYRLLNADKVDSSYNNVFYINNNINKDIIVDPLLYKAFQKINEKNDKYIFMGPLQDTYYNLFSSDEDSDAKRYDPYFSSETASYFQTITNFVNSNAISISLKENNVVCLNVSDEYIAYANECGFNSYINFGYYYDAVIIDYIYDVLISNKLPNFRISTYEGYTRSHFELSLDFNYAVYTYQNGYIIPEATVNINSTVTMIEYKIFPISTKEDFYYYVDTHRFAHHFIATSDGKYLSSRVSLYIYERNNTSLFDMLLNSESIFISSTFDTMKLKQTNYQYIYNDEYVIKYNDSNLIFASIFDQDDMKFTKELIND